jgi:lysine 2,3-aminomutase
MTEEWFKQMNNQVNTLEKLEKYINVSADEREAIKTLKTKWGTTPYFASLMDKDDPNCPIRKQVIPSMKEQVNEYGMENYLIWKENRATEEVRPDSIARQYHDRVAFTVVQDCGNYCRHCFRKELVVDQNLQLNFDVDEGLAWIAEHPEIRDVLVTGGDPLLLSDDKLEYLINKLREITTHRNDSHRLPASNSSTAACHRRFEKCYRRLPQSSSLDQYTV